VTITADTLAAVIRARHDYARAALYDVAAQERIAKASGCEPYAAIRYDAGYCHGIEGVAHRLASYLAETTPGFDKAAFLKACFSEG
jgi:hypothetical protein